MPNDPHNLGTGENRLSLTITIEDRYRTEHVGGAFDAKSAGVPTKTLPVGGIGQDYFNNEFSDGFTLRADSPSNYDLPKKDSALLTGFSSRKYVP
jgi:hypothetical protein